MDPNSSDELPRDRRGKARQPLPAAVAQCIARHAAAYSPARGTPNIIKADDACRVSAFPQGPSANNDSFFRDNPMGLRQ